MVARLKLKGIDGRAPSGVASVALFDTTREKLTRSRHNKDGQVDSSFLVGAMAVVVCWWSDWSGSFRQWTRLLPAEQCEVCFFF